MEDMEDTEYVASEHDLLVNAITKLDKTQHITEPTRNESTNFNSEFNLIKRSIKLDLNKVANVLKDTSHHVQISKKLKKTQDVSTVLPKPLEKPQAERIKRATGYEETKKKVGRWDPVVAHSRTVDYVTFPLKNVSSKLEPADEFISKFTLKSDLEKELDQIDPPVKEADEEEDQVYPMSYEEMVEHRQHLAKIRAQQSYRAAKAKRQSKIKSKKYHRILKKEKLKQQLKEFEELQKENPEEALKKLDALEKARALERHTLRHKNTGKWAKNQMIRAKYDKDVRQQIAEQLAVSRSLTKKVQEEESTDDDAEENENVPDITLAQDPMNPWMMKRSDKSNIDAEFDFGYKKYLKDKMFKSKADSESDSNDEQDNETFQNETSVNQLKILKQGVQKINQQGIQKLNQQGESKINSIKNLIKETEDTKPKKKLGEKKETKVPTATSNWVVESIADDSEENVTEEVSDAFDSLEKKTASEVNKKLKKLRQTIVRMEKNIGEDKKSSIVKNIKEKDNVEYLKLKNQRPKSVIDEELIEKPRNSNDKQKQENIEMVMKTAVEIPTEGATGSNIDPSRFIEVKPKYLKTVVPDGDNDLDALDDEQVVPKVNIEEVFEEDDVVASFRQEKEDEVKKDQLEDIDLSLPGWGSWGGKGVKATKRKKNRFILKAPPKMPRRDDNKGDIIIKEFRNPQLASHKVTQVPFPFKSVKDYEASIRAPIGNTFIPEKAHKQLIRPNVITKTGTIIDPMDEEELLQPKNKRFKNMDVIKLLSKK